MMKPHRDSDDLGRLAWGCLSAAVITLALIFVVAIACRSLSAQPVGSQAYIQYVRYQPAIGVAWCSNCPANAEKLGAFYYYACCSVCPPAGGARLAIMRPGWQWNSQCVTDYTGWIITGNEGEFCGMQDCVAAVEMADFIISVNEEFPLARLVCINSYDLDYAADVLALLPPGTCEAVGVHIYDNADISQHLDALCEDCHVWITEIGRCGASAHEDMKRMVTEALADGRIEMIFIYTDRNAHTACLNGLTAGGELRPPGAGFVSALVAYP